MADGDTTTIDPNTGQPTGWMNDLTQAFSNPLVQGLMGLSAGFGQAALPTRMRLPFGAVLGTGMGGFGQGIGNAYRMQQEQQQAQQTMLNNQLLRAQMPSQIAQAKVLQQYYNDPDIIKKLMTPGGLVGSAPTLPGGSGGAPVVAPTAAPGNAPPLIARDPSIPVAGDQANNPGNLMFAGQPDAIGRLPVSGGRTLAAFPDLVTGIGANANQLMINQDQYGKNTVRGQVAHWVNEPNANLDTYIKDVSKALGVGPDDPVDFHDPAVLQKFILAQRPHESGPAPLDPAVVAQGVQRAVSGRTAAVAQATTPPPAAKVNVPAASPFGGGAFNPARSWFGAPTGATTDDTGGPGVAAPGPQAQNNVGAIIAGMQRAQAALGNRAGGPLFAGPGAPTTGSTQPGFGTSAFGGSTAIAPPAPSGAPSGAPAAGPAVTPSAAPQPAGAPPAAGATPVPSNQGDAMRLYMQYQSAAADLEGRQNVAKFLKLPGPPGDPQLLRQTALQYLELANAGPKAFAAKSAELAAQAQQGPGIAYATTAAQEAAKLPFVGPTAAAQAAQKITIGRDGSVYQGATRIGGTRYDPGTDTYVFDQPVSPQAGGPPASNTPASPTVNGTPGAPVTPGSPAAQVTVRPGPGLQERLQQQQKVAADSYLADQKDAGELEGQGVELQGRMANTYAMRDLISRLPQTGWGGMSRADAANFVQTILQPYLGSTATDFLQRMGNLPPAELAQELAKLTTQAAGMQEKGAVGARGSLGLTELFLKNNPGLNTLPDANKLMANFLLAQSQMNLDYIRGLHDYITTQGQNYRDGKGYIPSSEFGRQWLGQDNQKLYVAAASALTGRPPGDWMKLLGGNEQSIGQVMSIVHRIDPTAHVMVPDPGGNPNGTPFVFGGGG